MADIGHDSNASVNDLDSSFFPVPGFQLIEGEFSDSGTRREKWQLSDVMTTQEIHFSVASASSSGFTWKRAARSLSS